MRLLRPIMVLFVAPLLIATFIDRSNAHEPGDSVDQFIMTMVNDHGFSKDPLVKLLHSAEKKTNILNAFGKPATAKPWSFFRKLYVTEFREKQGLKFWNTHADLLARAERQFGIPPEIVTALIGIETNYGSYTGEFRIVDAFYTLGFYGERRNKYFLKEFKEFLLLARENNMDPIAIKGSFAGAIGIAQFMPSSYREYAIDFDGDDKADLENSVADAVGSASNYLSRHGWRRGEPIVFPVSSKQTKTLNALAGKSKPNRSLRELREDAVDVDFPPLSDDTKVGFFKLEGEEGMEYWISMKNFYVITRYNPSNNYAMAIVQLSQKIKALKEND